MYRPDYLLPEKSGCDRRYKGSGVEHRRDVNNIRAVKVPQRIKYLPERKVQVSRSNIDHFAGLVLDPPIYRKARHETFVGSYQDRFEPFLHQVLRQPVNRI